MVPDITKTANLVQEISAASEEQASGIGQITSAMQQLDKVTQQNAAGSEELAATAEEMQAQSENLQQVVGFFCLSKDTVVNSSTRVTPALKPTPESEPSSVLASDNTNIDESKFKRF